MVYKYYYFLSSKFACFEKWFRWSQSVKGGRGSASPPLPGLTGQWRVVRAAQLSCLAAVPAKTRSHVATALAATACQPAHEENWLHNRMRAACLMNPPHPPDGLGTKNLRPCCHNSPKSIQSMASKDLELFLPIKVCALS